MAEVMVELVEVVMQVIMDTEIEHSFTVGM